MVAFRQNLAKPILTLALLAGAIHLGAFLFVALSRIGYRYELEWTEGSILVQVNHILQGLAIYVSPTPEYVPYVYTPFYFWLGAQVSVLGGGFLPLRLLSLIAILWAMVLAYRWIRTTTGQVAAGLLTVGLFVASFRPTGYWFDLARVDSLCLLLLLIGLRYLNAVPSMGSAAIAALAFTLAFFTKQTSLAVIAALLPYVFLKGLRFQGDEQERIQRKKFLFVFVLGTILALGGGILFLNWKSGGWFNYYIFQVSAGHAFIPGAWLRFWTHDILGQFALPFGLAAFALYRAFALGGLFSEVLWFRVCATVGMLGSAWITRTHVGSWDNVLMPAFAWLAVMAGWGLAETWPWRNWKGAVLGILFLFQFASLGYKPWQQIPTARDLAEGKSIESRIQSIPGNVWIPDHEYLAEWAGKKVFGNRMPLEDLRRGIGGVPQIQMEDSLRTLLKKKHFAGILLDSPDWREANMLPPEMDKWYRLGDSLPLAGRDFYPKTGVKSRPIYWFVPRE